MRMFPVLSLVVIVAATILPPVVAWHYRSLLHVLLNFQLLLWVLFLLLFPFCFRLSILFLFRDLNVTCISIFFPKILKAFHGWKFCRKSRNSDPSSGLLGTDFADD